MPLSWFQKNSSADGVFSWEKASLKTEEETTLGEADTESLGSVEQFRKKFFCCIPSKDQIDAEDEAEDRHEKLVVESRSLGLMAEESAGKDMLLAGEEEDSSTDAASETSNRDGIALFLQASVLAAVVAYDFMA